jgi:hypothetical protein
VRGRIRADGLVGGPVVAERRACLETALLLHRVLDGTG